MAAPALFFLAELLSSDQKLPGSVCRCHRGGAVEMCKLYIYSSRKKELGCLNKQCYICAATGLLIEKNAKVH